MGAIERRPSTNPVLQEANPLSSACAPRPLSEIYSPSLQLIDLKIVQSSSIFSEPLREQGLPKGNSTEIKKGNKFAGKKHSEATKQKLREFNVGRTHSEATKQKI